MCLFCQIINKKIPSEMVYEDENLVVFKDINPRAIIHFLIVPKKHIESISQLEEGDKALLGEIFYRAKLLAEKLKINESGYKLVINTGKDGGQIIDHIHLHLLGGQKIKGLV